MAVVEGISPGRSSLDQHRFVVAGATFDELDHKQDADGSNSNRDLSVASTVDVDNTHPYLMRYADIYANDNSDASSVGTGPTFVGVKPASRFQKGQKVLYTGSNGPSEATVMRVLYDDENQPHYTIKLASGKEEQTESAKLNRKTTSKGATDENGEAPKKCASFKTDPTPLFQSLYQGLWHTAHQLLLSHPEQARIWVARYAKMSPGSFDGGEVRWQLLPLHLFVALGGRSNEDTSKPEDADAPDDEKDEIEQMEKENEGSPPMRLLTALLSAYPQATQCTDDQNMIPLQSAIRGNVSLSIIEKLLEVDPSSVYRKDGRGRNAFALSEKVFGKHVHEKQVGNEDKAREMKYAKLTNLLSDAARRVSSSAKSQPKEKAQGVRTKPQEENNVNQRLKQLQNENLALRRENAELRHRSEINTNLLQQLVEKLQMYEDQRSIDIENYNEIFGSKDELCERREGILLSISEDDDAQERKTEEGGVEEEENEHTTEEKQVGGEGAYHKRLERYLTLTPTSSKGNINIISPSSTMTEATEPENKNSPVSTVKGATEPVTPHSPSVRIPNLENSDDYDANNSANAQANDVNGSKTSGDGIRISSKASSESDESSTSNTEGQDIFRPRKDDTQDCTLDNSQSHKEIERHPDDSSNAVARPSDTSVGDIDMTKKDDDDAVAASQPESSATFEPKVVMGLTATDGKDTGSERPVVLTAFSEEEVDQLCVE